jgi:cyclophilin family peptidyl-prolyl cis-trans isomerase
MVPYDRGGVGMALSGKDTGGSQWFVTHSPQPHLDGGYTVFGRVVNGMDVVDTIVRGDSIVSVSIREEPGAKKRVN